MTGTQEELEGFWKAPDALVYARVNEHDMVEVTRESGSTETIGTALFRQAVGRGHYEKLEEGEVYLEAGSEKDDTLIEYQGPKLSEV